MAPVISIRLFFSDFRCCELESLSFGCDDDGGRGRLRDDSNREACSRSDAAFWRSLSASSLEEESDVVDEE